MADLVTKFDNVTVSATIVCVGNRRKEQNLVKKTKGFGWGASAVGTGESQQCAWTYRHKQQEYLCCHKAEYERT